MSALGCKSSLSKVDKVTLDAAHGQCNEQTLEIPTTSQWHSMSLKAQDYFMHELKCSVMRFNSSYIELEGCLKE